MSQRTLFASYLGSRVSPNASELITSAAPDFSMEVRSDSAVGTCYRLEKD
jgi:hypothetical protein